MCLRVTSRTNKDRSKAAYVLLAHSRRDAETHTPEAEILFNFGRHEEVDLEALRRLVRSITRFLGPENALKAATSAVESKAAMTRPDRATIGTMAFEYGATMGFFPIDDEALHYLAASGHTSEHVDLVERVAKAQRLFRADPTPNPEFTAVFELDLGARQVRRRPWSA